MKSEIKENIRKRFNSIFDDGGALPVCKGNIDTLLEVVESEVDQESEFVAGHISEMMARGWAVTFPAFKNARAFLLEAKKGDINHQATWTGQSDLFSAVEKLSQLTCESDEKAERARETKESKKT